MLDQNEIEKRLTEVSPIYAAAFAVRAAMRIFPALAISSENLNFPGRNGDQIKLLFSIMHAHRTSYCKLIIQKPSGIETIYRFHEHAPWAYAAEAVYAGYYAADSTMSARAFAAVHAYIHPLIEVDGVIDCIIKAASFLKYKMELETILFQELNLIKLERDNFLKYLEKPLWLGESPTIWQENWIFFKQWVLAFDTGFSGFLDWFDARIAGKPIDLELLEMQVLLPQEIRAQDITSINAYLDTLAQAHKTLNWVRAIFMGHGTAGKTSLVRCIQNKNVVEGKEDMTPGIDISEWSLPNSPIKALLWDFGGQVIAHATHKFFLRSGCLYVLVMDARAEINATEQAQYWLEHVKAFAGSAPVMLVGNKSDLVRINLDLETLTERYPNIVGFYNLSCTKYKTKYKSEFDSFMRDFIQNLKQLGLIQVRFMEEYYNAVDTLRAVSRQQAFLTQAEFNQFCAHAGVKQEGFPTRAWLLDTLDKLGVIIHFPDLPFHDAYVLNPRWLTYGVYTLLYSQEAKENKGQLTKRQVITILQREEIQDEQGHRLSYPADKCGFIIEAMRSFKLCYYLKNDPDTLVIPDLLPSERPSLVFDKNQSGIVFEFRFPHLLPRHVMPMFIVFRHDDIENNQVWQTGVVLRNHTHSARALATANYSDRVITLHVQGIGAKDYLHILHDEIMQIIQKLKDLSYKEWVELPESAMINRPLLLQSLKERADYRQLLNMLKDGQERYISSSGFKYDLFKVLGGIMTRDTLEKETGDSYVINGGNIVFNKGNMKNTALGGDVNIQQLSNNLNTDLRQLIDILKVEIEDSQDKTKALRELELLREHVSKVRSTSPTENEDAKSGLKEFAEKLKNGVSYTAQVTKDISTISEKLPGLIEKIGSFVEILPF